MRSDEEQARARARELAAESVAAGDTRDELDAARGPLRAHRVERFIDGEDPPRLRWRTEFRRD